MEDYFDDLARAEKQAGQEKAAPPYQTREDGGQLYAVMTLDDFHKAIEQAQQSAFRAGFNRGWAQANTLHHEQASARCASTPAPEAKPSPLRSVWKWTATAVVIAAGAALIWALNQG